MTDTTQGADAPDDNALFNEVVKADTLTKFENPEPVPAPDKPAPPQPEPPKPGDPPRPDDNAPVPPGRLREEAENRRRAERERDALQARIDAMTRQPQPQPQPQPTPDMFENPPEYVRGLVMPIIEQRDAFFLSQLEGQSKKAAVRHYGAEKVDAAFTALAQGMRNGDPTVKQAYDQIMASPDRFGDMVEWHQHHETMREIGSDLEAYNKRVIEKAIADPEVRKRILESMKGQAATVGNTVARPVVASSPSLGSIGAAGGDQQAIEPDDMTLFRAATQAKRR